MKSYTPKTSNEAVKKATGKTWNQWFGLLDKNGAKTMKHIDIARLLYNKYLGNKGKKSVSPDVAKRTGWWSQMVTVEYERSRGLRQVNQTTSGFSISVNRTVDASISKLFNSWRLVGKKQGLVESTVHKNKSIRYKAEKGKSLHVVGFMKKDARSSRISLEIMRLAKQGEIEKQRSRWKKIIDQMQRQLETDKGIL